MNKSHWLRSTVTASILSVLLLAPMWEVLGGTASAADDRVRVLAPIELAEVVRGRMPENRYRVEVRAALPNGCVEPAGYRVRRDGNAIRVRVFNSEPVEPMFCTMIYRTYDLSIGLERDFVRGETYTVDVNGTVLTFVAK